MRPEREEGWGMKPDNGWGGGDMRRDKT